MHTDVGVASNDSSLSNASEWLHWNANDGRETKPACRRENAHPANQPDETVACATLLLPSNETVACVTLLQPNNEIVSCVTLFLPSNESVACATLLQPSNETVSCVTFFLPSNEAVLG